MTSNMFQFQTGSIKSIASLRRASVKNRFQFQTGSIKSIASISYDTYGFPSFNSKLVRLKGREVDRRVHFGIVSIPNWFD